MWKDQWLDLISKAKRIWRCTLELEHSLAAFSSTT